MKKFYLLLSYLLIACFVMAQDCPPEGDGTTIAKKELNQKKNRQIDVSTSQEPEDLPLKNLLPSKKRKNDKKLWKEGAYVVMEGYLVDFEEEGPESCNCAEAKASDKSGDVHMFLGLRPGSAKKNCLVVEITPAFKKKFPNYEDLLLKKSKIKVKGYLFYDYPHEKDAFTTCSTCSHIWRKTPWEVHPITELAIIEQPN
jgi:hypothetical protein